MSNGVKAIEQIHYSRKFIVVGVYVKNKLRSGKNM